MQIIAEGVFEPADAQIADGCGYVLGVVVAHEEEVAVAGRDVGHLALDDAVGVGDDQALHRLSENLVERYNGDDSRRYHVIQNISCSDRGQLIAVADEDQAAGEGQRAQKRLHQGGIHHADLVDNQSVGVEQIAFIALEHRLILDIIADLEHTVDGFGFFTCYGCYTLSGSAGRRAQADLFSALL